MATIAENLLSIDSSKTDLAANLTTKGVTAADTETLAALVNKVLDVTTDETPIFYSGFGQLLGTADDGGQTFTGYGQVHGEKIGNTLLVWGEALIYTNTNSAADHYKTGVSIANCLTALGITDTYTYKGNYHNTIEVFNSTGAKVCSGDGNYGYGLISEINSGILNIARYYTTGGSVGGWGSNNNIYATGKTWKFSFILEAT